MKAMNHSTMVTPPVGVFPRMTKTGMHMKKINLFLTCISAMVAFASCVEHIEESIDEPVAVSSLTFSASIDAPAT